MRAAPPPHLRRINRWRIDTHDKRCLHASLSRRASFSAHTTLVSRMLCAAAHPQFCICAHQPRLNARTRTRCTRSSCARHPVALRVPHQIVYRVTDISTAGTPHRVCTSLPSRISRTPHFNARVLRVEFSLDRLRLPRTPNILPFCARAPLCAPATRAPRSSDRVTRCTPTRGAHGLRERSQHYAFSFYLHTRTLRAVYNDDQNIAARRPMFTCIFHI